MSPDGRLVAFASNRAGGVHFDVYVTPLAGGAPRRLTRLSRGGYPTVVVSLEWSPDGRRLAFIAGEDLPKYNIEQSTLYVVDAETGHLRALSGPNDSAGSAEWSPRSTAVAFHRFPTTEFDAPAEIVVDRQSRQRRLLAIPLGELLGYEWHPDGRRLVIFGSRSIEIVDSETGAGDSIPLEEGTDLGDLSPDGSQLVVESGYELWLMRLDGRNRRRLTSTPFADLDATFSPDGTRIVFRTITDVAAEELRLLTLADAKVRVLERGESEHLGLEWSPDGKWLAYTRNGDPHLMHVPSGEAEPSPGDFDWTPDGGAIVFSHPFSYDDPPRSALYVRLLGEREDRRLTQRD